MKFYSASCLRHVLWETEIQIVAAIFFIIIIYLLFLFFFLFLFFPFYFLFSFFSFASIVCLHYSLYLLCHELWCDEKFKENRMQICSSIYSKPWDSLIRTHYIRYQAIILIHFFLISLTNVCISSTKIPHLLQLVWNSLQALHLQSHPANSVKYLITIFINDYLHSTLGFILG